MTTANLTVFPCVCQMETLGMKGLIGTWVIYYLLATSLSLLKSPDSNLKWANGISRRAVRDREISN